MSPTPEYRCYAAAHGRSPQHQLAWDDGVYHGGGLVRFRVWIGRMREQFSAQHPEAFYKGAVDQKAFCTWLENSSCVAQAVVHTD